MSYILDALKKSQQQRGQTLNTADSSTQLISATAEVEKPHHVIFWVVLALAFICVCLLVLLVLPTRQASSDDVDDLASYASVKAPLTTPIIESPFEVVNAESNLEASESAVDFHETDLLETQLPASPAPALVVGDGVVVDSSELAQKPITSSAQTEPVNRAHSGQGSSSQPEKVVLNKNAASNKPTVEVRSLPPIASLRKIPALMITSHIFSSVPDKRSVTMNNRIWREGEPVSNGVLLKEITPQGILLDVDGWPLHVNRQQGWQPIPTGN